MRISIRELVLVGALGTAAFVADRRTGARPERPAPSDERFVILVVADGMRWQEVFRGADSALVHGGRRALDGDAEAVRRRWWRGSSAERRRALMPFVWGTMAREGTLLGDRDAGSVVRVTNPMWFSYPGYNELLTGRPDPRIDRNDYGPNPNVTVFEWLNGREGFRGRVVAVGGWGAFADIFNVERSGIPHHAARRDPIDASSHAAAVRVLAERRPRALFVAYVETDDWAHQGRYDRTLDAVHAVDGYLAELWAAAQTDPRTRGRTTLVLTADHGRGRTARDWTDHARRVPGSDEIFVLAIGPGVPASGAVRGGEAVTQSQVAATVARAVGENFPGVTGRAAPPIRALAGARHR